MRTIIESDHGRDNNYHLLRLIAALLVIVGHSYYLSTSGGGDEPLRMLTGYKHFGEVGVQIFFVISGFLVTKSFLSRQDLMSYLEARLLRIFPALVVVVTVSVFVVGPWATTLPLGDYFAHQQIYLHLFKNISLTTAVWGLPGVFETVPWRGAVNGSLWSLFPEIRLYLFVALLGVLGLLAPKRRFNFVLILGLLLIAQVPELFQFLLVVFRTPDGRVLAYFALGAFCYINRDVVPIHWGIVVVLSVLAVLLHGTLSFPVAFDLAVCYAVLFFAYVPSPEWIRRFNKTGDYSYGIYLYAFPVQQMIAFKIPTVTALPMMALTFVFTLPLAMLSWHMIEQPSLASKGKFLKRLAQSGRRLSGTVPASPLVSGADTTEIPPLQADRSTGPSKPQ